MSYDPACYDLARHFMGDLTTERLRTELAQHIQTSIEDWIEGQATDIKEKIEESQIVKRN